MKIPRRSLSENNFIHRSSSFLSFRTILRWRVGIAVECRRTLSMQVRFSARLCSSVALCLVRVEFAVRRADLLYLLRCASVSAVFKLSSPRKLDFRAEFPWGFQSVSVYSRTILFTQSSLLSEGGFLDIYIFYENISQNSGGSFGHSNWQCTCCIYMQIHFFFGRTFVVQLHTFTFATLFRIYICYVVKIAF